jgi:hypothetical protein
LWRYAQKGDLPGYGATIDGALLKELVAANTGKNAIAFTHKPSATTLSPSRTGVSSQRPLRPASRSISRLTI